MSHIKPGIIFGLIFGVLGIPLIYYAINTMEGECWWFVIIGITAGSAGLITGLTEKAQSSGEAGKAGATAGVITGILCNLSLGIRFYPLSNTISDFFLFIFDIFILSIIMVPISVMVGAFTAIIATPVVMKSIAERGKKHRLILITGVIAAVFTYFAIPETISLLSQYGIFNSWSTIKNPPSGVARVLGVSGNQDSITGTGAFLKTEVWIKTQDEQILSTSFCGSQPCDLFQWKSSPNIITDYFTENRGTDCKKLGDFPLNPSGQIIECVYVTWVNGDIPSEIYLVQMADGSLKYFAPDLGVQIKLLFKFIFITVLIYFVMFMLVFRLMNYLAKQIQL